MLHARLLVLLAPVLLVAACGGSGDAAAGSGAASQRPKVIAAFAPLATVASAVGGAAVDVTTLTPPGVEPHDLELSASQVADIAAADLVLYVPGFQPAVDEAVAQQAADRAIDATAGITMRTADDATDPHVWLDPKHMATIASSFAERVTPLIAADSQPGVATRTAEFDAQMNALDADYRARLAGCATQTMVVSHEAFGYLADAYGFQQVGISGLSPDAEPSPARLAEVADAVRGNGVTTIYSETLVDPKVAQTLADEVGVATAVLDPIEGIADGSSYDSVMRANLDVLAKGQRCA